MEAMAATMETWQQAELHRLAGIFALMGRDPNAATAETHFMRALAIAREQRAKSWELRAATSLARLWRAQGKHRRAHGLLDSICASLTEGLDTQDMTDARLLLGDLAA
jgi:predicted ATPase